MIRSLLKLFKGSQPPEERRGVVLGPVLDVYGACTLVVSESRRGGFAPSDRRITVRSGFSWYSAPGVSDHACRDLLGRIYVWRFEDQYNPHIVVSGSSGSGKSSFLKALVWDLRKVYGFPITIVDFHGEYRELGVALGGKVFDLGKLSVNPFSSIDRENPEAPRERIYDFVESLRVRYPDMGSVQLGILVDVSRRLFRGRGIRDEDPSSWLLRPPTFGDLYREISRLADYSRRGVAQRVVESASSLKLKLEPLLEVFGSENSVDLADIASAEVSVVDLSKLPSEEAKDVVVEWLLRKMLKWRMRRGLASPGFKYVVIDEAHRVARIIVEGSSAVYESIISTVMRESRKYGIGLILSTQRYTDLPDAVRVNVATKIFMRMDSRENVEEVAATLFGDAASANLKLSSLGRHECIVVDSVLARRGCAVHVRVTPYFERSEIVEALKAAAEALKGLEASANSEEQSQPAGMQLSEGLWRVLEVMRVHRVYTLSMIAARAGYAKSTTSQYLRKLVRMGLVEEVVLVDLASGRPRKLFIPKDQTQTALHRALVAMIKAFLDYRGIPSAVFNTRDKPDIEALIGGRRIAIEVETGLKHDPSKIREMIVERLSEYDEVVVVTPNEAARRRYEEALRDLVEEYEHRVKVVEYRELPDALWPATTWRRGRTKRR